VNLHGIILVINILLESTKYRIDDNMSYLVRYYCVAFDRFENKLHELTS
jgi:hypothetical protein